MNQEIINKLAAYLAAKRKFNDYSCYLMTPAVEKLLGLTPEEMNSAWRTGKLLYEAFKKVYPETTKVLDSYVFGQADDETAFDKWLSEQPDGAVLALFEIEKLKEKILLRGILATYRTKGHHVILFQEKFEGHIPPYIWMNCCNAEDINPDNPLAAPIRERPQPQPQPQPETPLDAPREQEQPAAEETAVESQPEPAGGFEIIQEVVLEPVKEEVVKDSAEKVPEKQLEVQPVAEPVPHLYQKNVQKPAQQSAPAGKRNYIAEAYKSAGK